MPDREQITESWRVILAELEADVARVRAGSVGERLVSADWSPPTVLGPLPEEYAHHVRDLIEAQREALAAIEHARRSTGAQIGALRATESTADERRPVYLDVEG